jgi:hypothetical protein
MPTCDIVIVSHRKDLTWLYLNLRLLLKNWRTPGNIVVRLEEDCRDDIANWRLGPRVIYRYVRPWADGYTFQMYQKMISDDFSPAEILVLCDSDLMLLAPASLDTVMHEGKPIVEYCHWSSSDPISERMWRATTSRVMGIDLDRDYMVQAPFLFWRDTFSKTRQRIVEVTGQGFYEAIHSTVPFNYQNFLSHPVTFADYEALNLYAVKFETERYFLRSNAERPLDWPWRLYWSHGDWSPEVERFLTSKL